MAVSPAAHARRYDDDLRKWGLWQGTHSPSTVHDLARAHDRNRDNASIRTPPLKGATTVSISSRKMPLQHFWRAIAGILLSSGMLAALAPVGAAYAGKLRQPTGPILTLSSAKVLSLNGIGGVIAFTGQNLYSIMGTCWQPSFDGTLCKQSGYYTSSSGNTYATVTEGIMPQSGTWKVTLVGGTFGGGPSNYVLLTFPSAPTAAPPPPPPAPLVTGFSPASLPENGGVVTIEGENLENAGYAVLGSTTINIPPAWERPSSGVYTNTPTSLIVDVPPQPSAASLPIQVITPGGTSAPVNLPIEPEQWLTLSASSAAVMVGSAVDLTATAGTLGGTPTGIVQFEELGYPTMPLGVSTIGANGVAVLATTAITPGQDVIEATWDGASAVVPVTVNQPTAITIESGFSTQGTTTLTVQVDSGAYLAPDGSLSVSMSYAPSNNAPIQTAYTTVSNIAAGGTVVTLPTPGQVLAVAVRFNPIPASGELPSYAAAAWSQVPPVNVVGAVLGRSGRAIARSISGDPFAARSAYPPQS